MKSPTKDSTLSNAEIARANRAEFDAAGVTVVSVVGPAGSGKTSIIEALLLRTCPPVRAAVLVGSLAAQRQSQRLNRHGYQAIALTTGELDADYVRQTLPELKLDELDLLIIEANSTSLSHADFDLGQHLRVGVLSGAGGDDKASEHPFLVAASDLILLTKADLLPFVSFDIDLFCEDIRQIKPGLDVIQTSATRNQGIDTWMKWLEFHTRFNDASAVEPRLFHPFAKWFQE